MRGAARDKTHETRPLERWMTIDHRVIPALLTNFRPAPSGAIWEPAAGEMHMVKALRENGFRVIASDIERHAGTNLDFIADFLECEELPGDISAIVTNPPNSLNIEFALKAIELMESVRGMVALYQRHEWDTTKESAAIFDHPAYAYKITCRFRPKWVEPVSDKKKSSPFHRWSWYVFDWSSFGSAPLQRFA